MHFIDVHVKKKNFIPFDLKTRLQIVHRFIKVYNSCATNKGVNQSIMTSVRIACRAQYIVKSDAPVYQCLWLMKISDAQTVPISMYYPCLFPLTSIRPIVQH